MKFLYAVSSSSLLHITVEPQYDEPLYSGVLGIMNYFFTPAVVKYLEKNLDITKPRYSEQILPVP